MKLGKMENLKKSHVIIIVVLVAVCALLAVLLVVEKTSAPQVVGIPVDNREEAPDPDTGLENLRQAVKTGAAGLEGNVTVFLSVSDGSKKASVYSGTGQDFDQAWGAVETQAKAYGGGEGPLWVKADLVTSVTKTAKTDLTETLSARRENFFRQGVALDKELSVAFLEEELNVNRILTYEGKGMRLKALNTYLESMGRSTVEKLPKNLYVFDTQGWFLDESGTVHKLNAGTYDHGHRPLEAVGKQEAYQIIESATDYLAGQLQEDGHFVYGYRANTAKTLPSENILRHTGTILSLISRHSITPDEALAAKINLAVECLVNEYIEYQTEDTAFVIERKNDEIKLGGNALAVVALTSYQDEFGTDKYQPLAEALGNGILQMMDMQTGAYRHVYELPDYTLKDEFRTVYYDGEATYALARLYSITGEEQWIEAAKTALRYFIEQDYTTYRDHWVSYAINEVTKFAPEEEFFDLGLRNAGENLKTIYQQKTAYHTYMELLMCTFELYDRMLENGYESPYLAEFDQNYFFETIQHRASFMLNAYGYPEVVMYFEDPQLALGSFFIRQDNFRMRIDDVQHFVGGYYSYYVNYEKLMEYVEKAGL